MQKLLAWLGWVLLSFAAAIPGAVWAPGAWYDTLEKPTWTPPGWAFPVVWTTLYALMGTAAWRVWRVGRDTPGRRTALGLFLVQLALNAAWTPVFFGAHQILGGLAVIVALWLAIAATGVSFGRVDRLAGVLFVPYLAWVTLATALNLTIWRLNP